MVMSIEYPVPGDDTVPVSLTVHGQVNANATVQVTLSPMGQIGPPQNASVVQGQGNYWDWSISYNNLNRNTQYFLMAQATDPASGSTAGGALSFRTMP
jgi:hypothetical protein